MKEFLEDYIKYLKARKKYIFIPIVLFSLFLSVLAFLGKGAAVAPFIYSIF